MVLDPGWQAVLEILTPTLIVISVGLLLANFSYSLGAKVQGEENYKVLTLVRKKLEGLQQEAAQQKSTDPELPQDAKQGAQNVVSITIDNNLERAGFTNKGYEKTEDKEDDISSSSLKGERKSSISYKRELPNALPDPAAFSASVNDNAPTSLSPNTNGEYKIDEHSKKNTTAEESPNI